MRTEIFSLNSYGEGLPQLREFLTNSAGDNRNKIISIKRALRSAIAHELSDRQREVLSMYYYEGRGVSDIAKTLNINKSSVSRRLKRARLKLERVLKYGYFPEWDESAETFIH